MQKKILLIIWIVLLVIAVGVAAGYFTGIFQKERVIVPHITPTAPGTSPIVSTHKFPFEQSLVTISIPVNRSVFEGARNADKSVTIFGNVSENIWMADSYRAMAGDPTQEELYRTLIAEFRNMKAEMGLSDDEYIELLATYTQSLRYETVAENPAKFPVETVVDASGDCDDKSLLLAGLLSHEGYDVALFSFGPETHMAVGVGSDQYLYKNTNYTFIETTNFSFIGVPTGTLDNGVVLKSNPIVIPIGSGSNGYHSGGQTRYISDTLLLSERNAKELEVQVLSMDQDMKARWDTVTRLEEQMITLRSSGNIGEYNALVSEHNSLVSEYNTRLNNYRQLRVRYEQYATVYNYIIGHEYDRKGVYEYIKTNLPT
nr:hypothetical protein [uncultured Methanoregula sp.]